MKTPEEKYRNDPNYRHFVVMVEQMLEKATYTPSELREMCMLACINYEMRRTRGYSIDSMADQALKTLEDYKKSDTGTSWND